MYILIFSSGGKTSKSLLDRSGYPCLTKNSASFPQLINGLIYLKLKDDSKRLYPVVVTHDILLALSELNVFNIKEGE